MSYRGDVRWRIRTVNVTVLSDITFVGADRRSRDHGLERQASYLLQIYAGYFLFLLLTGLFCIDARIFSRAKVNYQFVFEFDARHTLDWRQLCEIPSVFFSVLALVMYFNFTLRLGGEVMYIWWPVVLVGLSIIIMLLVSDDLTALFYTT